MQGGLECHLRTDHPKDSPLIKAIKSLWLKGAQLRYRASLVPCLLLGGNFQEVQLVTCGLCPLHSFGAREEVVQSTEVVPSVDHEGGSPHTEVALGRASRIFGLEYFSFSSDKERGRKKGRQEKEEEVERKEGGGREEPKKKGEVNIRRGRGRKEEGGKNERKEGEKEGGRGGGRE